MKEKPCSCYGEYKRNWYCLNVCKYNCEFSNTVGTTCKDYTEQSEKLLECMNELKQ